MLNLHFKTRSRYVILDNDNANEPRFADLLLDCHGWTDEIHHEDIADLFAYKTRRESPEILVSIAKRVRSK